MDKKNFQNIKSNLISLLSIGNKQISLIRESQTDTVKGGLRQGSEYMQINGILLPTYIGIAEIITKPLLFLLQQIESYWVLYKHALVILDQPSVQFLMRSLIDIAYSWIILYSSKSISEQKQIAIKFWLCSSGLIINASSKNKSDILRCVNYHALVDMLDNKSKQEFFIKLANQGYPQIPFFKELNRILPSVMDPAVCTKVEENLDKLWEGRAPKGGILDIQSRYMSMMIHVNPIMIKLLESEGESLNYLLRCAKIMYFTSCSIILLCENNLSVKLPEANKNVFREIKDSFGQFLFNLWKSN